MWMFKNEKNVKYSIYKEFILNDYIHSIVILTNVTLYSTLFLHICIYENLILINILLWLALCNQNFLKKSCIGNDEM